MPATQPLPDFDDEDLKTQEQMVAELRKLQREKVGWGVERQGLQGQIDVLQRKVAIEVERGDFFKTAALAGQKIDVNSQKMDANSLIIQTTQENRIAEKNEKIADLQGDLRSCQDSRKYYAIGGAALGAAGGWFLRGSLSTLTGNPLARANEFNFRPLPEFSNKYTMPQMQDPNKPANDFLKLVRKN